MGVIDGDNLFSDRATVIAKRHLLLKRKSRAVHYLDGLHSANQISKDELWKIDEMLQTKTEENINLAIGILTARFGYEEINEK